MHARFRIGSVLRREILRHKRIGVRSLGNIPDLPVIRTESSVSSLAGAPAYRPSFLERWLESPLEHILESIEVLHFTGELPWWFAISGAAVAVRMAIFPLLLYQMRQVTKIAEVSPVIGMIIKRFNESTGEKNRSTGEIKEAWRRLRADVRELKKIQKVKFSHFLIYPVSLFTTFLPFVFAARKAVFRSDHDLEQGGFLWFENLTQPDPYTVLPFVAVGATYVVLQMGLGRIGSKENHAINWLSYLVYYIQLLELCMIPFIVELPAGIFMYWIPSAVVGMAQKRALGTRFVAEGFMLPHPELTRTPEDWRILPLEKRGTLTYVEGYCRRLEQWRALHATSAGPIPVEDNFLEELRKFQIRDPVTFYKSLEKPQIEAKKIPEKQKKKPRWK